MFDSEYILLYDVEKNTFYCQLFSLIFVFDNYICVVEDLFIMCCMFSRKTDGKAQGSICRSLQKQICCEIQNQVLHSQGTMPLLKECHVTLDSIITEYLTNQHALCKNPMVTCPQFNLFMWVSLALTTELLRLHVDFSRL